MTTNNGTVIPQSAFQTSISVYQCPSDDGAILNVYYGSASGKTDGNYAKSNYVVNRYVCGPDAAQASASRAHLCLPVFIILRMLFDWRIGFLGFPLSRRTITRILVFGAGMLA